MEKKIKFKSFLNISGKLVPFYCNLGKKFPFKNKRVFLVYGKKNFKRSDHAHKKCNQLLFCVAGKIQVIVNKKKKYLLSQKSCEALLVPKFHWSEIFFKEKNSILLVFCDQNYSSKDYIRKYTEFLKIKKL